MGACGCGDFYADKVYKLPSGTWVAIQLYPGCRDCDTPLGVMVHVFNAKGAKDWRLADGEVEHVTPDEYGALLGGLPMLTPDDLLTAVKEIGYEVGEGKDQYATLAEYIEDQGRELLRSAFFACRQRVAAELRADAERGPR